MHEWVDHTSEVELRVRAAAPEAVVEEATAALAGLLGEPAGDLAARRLEVAAADRAGLLAAWLEELVFVAESEALLAESAAEVELGTGTLRGEVRLRPGRPAYLVKAVTYHRLAFEADGSGWWGRVVLDV